MSMVDELDEAGYLPIEKLLAFPQILQLNANFEELQKELTTVVNEKRYPLKICYINRITRAKIMIEKLQQGGIPITWEQLEKHCQTCLPSRPRIGEVLVVCVYMSI